MRKALEVCGLSLLIFIAMDVAIGIGLSFAERAGRFGSLVQYFEYGRSTPGKLAKWEADPEAPGNLYDVAWRDEAVRISRAGFIADAAGDQPAIRSYGMSFVDNILRAALDLDPAFYWDSHGGPGAPPNYTFALFEDDRANRRAGDIAILGVLSSAVPAMAALSNRTWVFEQPAPFTYPIYELGADGLARIEPVVTSAAMNRSLKDDHALRRAWLKQLSHEDRFYSPRAFAAAWLDISPFARLVRRSLAVSQISRTKAGIVNANAYPYRDVLSRMIASFAEQARRDGVKPVVFLIQTGDLADADLVSVLKETLQAHAIPYLATAELAEIRNPSNFAPDGHYTPEADRIFAEQFLEMLAAMTSEP